MTAWLFITDGGPDQLGCRRLVLDDIAEKPSTIWIWVWCLHHVLHLIAGTQIKNLWGGYVFKAIAKIVNVWRSRGNPGKVIRALSEGAHHNENGNMNKNSGTIKGIRMKTTMGMRIMIRTRIIILYG